MEQQTVIGAEMEMSAVQSCLVRPGRQLPFDVPKARFVVRLSQQSWWHVLHPKQWFVTQTQTSLVCGTKHVNMFDEHTVIGVRHQLEFS